MEHPLRIGIWALVHGNRAALNDPLEPYDASWERNRKLMLEAEALGYDCTLIAQHTANPHRDDLDQLEAWTSAAALAALTSRIEIITAIKPMLYHPVVLAKMALQIEAHQQGPLRASTWSTPGTGTEIVNAGMEFREHDERYAYGEEWLHGRRDADARRAGQLQGQVFRRQGLRPAADQLGAVAAAHLCRRRVRSGARRSAPGRPTCGSSTASRSTT